MLLPSWGKPARFLYIKCWNSKNAMILLCRKLCSLGSFFNVYVVKGVLCTLPRKYTQCLQWPWLHLTLQKLFKCSYLCLFVFVFKSVMIKNCWYFKYLLHHPSLPLRKQIKKYFGPHNCGSTVRHIKRSLLGQKLS